MLCLVTGAAGFVGSHLTEKLLLLGHEVVGIDCFTDYYDRSVKERNLKAAMGQKGFRLIEDDLVRMDLDAALSGVDFVFHQAGQPGVRGSWGQDFAVYTHNNILATQRLLESAKNNGTVKKVVYASSSSVYGDTPDLPMKEVSPTRPHSPYGVTKLAAEHLCELYRANFGIPTVSLRYFTVYGPRQRPDMGFNNFIRRLLNGQPIQLFDDGEQTRDFTFISDVVDANIAAMSSNALGVFNIGGGSRVTVRHVLRTLSEITGANLEIEFQGNQAGDVRHTFADTSKAAKELGFIPKVRLKDGLTLQTDFQKAST